MTMPAEVAAPVAAPVPNIEARASALKATYAEEAAAPEPAVETSGAGEGTSAGSSAADSAPAAPTVESSKASDRLERIAQVRAREERDKAERQERAARRQKDTESEKLRARLSELEPLESVFSSEEALLEMAEKKGLTPEKLVSWMRQRLQDPTAVAKQQAKSEADKLREEMADLRKELAAKDEAAKAEATKRAQETEAVERANTFVSDVTTKAAVYPLTAALLKRHGPVGLVNFANKFIAPLMPEAFDLSELHDHMEQFLDEVQAGTFPATDATSANGTSQPSTKKSGAEKPVTTLSNAITSDRATATEEVPLARLSKEERERRLREKLARGE